jgi:UDPglucose--hexose-1-phosphate uridylyltransferase
VPFDDFEIAIFGNRFPGLHPGASAPRETRWPEHTASGACEVIAYGPEAEGSLATVSQARRVLLIEAIIHRYAAHFAAGAAYVLPFENRGDAVGVTLHHPHGQLYAFPFVPEPQAFAARAFAEGYDLGAARKIWGQEYDVARVGSVSAFVPPYARYPYEAWIATDRAVAGPWEMTAEEIEGLAAMMGDMTRRYDALFGKPMPYMMSLQAAPQNHAGGFHFTVQYNPLLRDANRIKYAASVEHVTGVFTVDYDPVVSAATLRAAQ